MRELELVLRTMVFATNKHEGQYRSGGKIPYIIHPVSVAHLLTGVGADLITICSGLLHDVKEDCGVTDQEIRALYRDVPEVGEDIVGVVHEHTDPPGLLMEDAKQREIRMMRAGEYTLRARLVIIADQTANMIDLVIRAPNWGRGAEQRYIGLMEELVDAGRGTSAELEAQFDEASNQARQFYGMTPRS